MKLRILGIAFVLLLAGCSKTNPDTCMTDSQCVAPANTCCGGTCVDLLTSALHCGNCAIACGTQNAAARCNAGVCGLTCSSGFGDCNSTNKDGCETSLATSASNCGMCGHLCTSTNASSLCDRSACQRSSCNSGYGDCNQDSTDGCEVNLKVSLLHCGACGKKCEVLNGAPDCSAGNCNILTCNPGFGDCDSNALTGCEVELSSSDAHCSVCGMACPSGQHCKLSKCVAPELVFYGGLVDAMSSVASGEVSAFNIDSRSWSAVMTGNSDAGSEVPLPRFGHAAVWDPTGQQMVIWGGYTANNMPADSFVWALDYSGASPSWKKLTVAGTPPTPRGLMGTAFDKTTRILTVFGGGDPSGAGLSFSDTWQLDLAALKWTERLDPGGPSARLGPAMAWDSARQRIVVGLGSDQFGSPVPGFYTFDPASADGGGWSPLNANNPPSARLTATFLGAAQPLRLWGGIDEMFTPYFDLFTLDKPDPDGGVDLDAGEAWSLSRPDNLPEGRGYALGTSAGTRRFSYGGINYSFVGVEQFNDVWELNADAGWVRVADAGAPFSHPGRFLGSVVARE